MYNIWSTVGPFRPWATLCQHEDVRFPGAGVMGRLSWVRRTECLTLQEGQVLLSTEPSLQEVIQKRNCYDILFLCGFTYMCMALWGSEGNPVEPGLFPTCGFQLTWTQVFRLTVDNFPCWATFPAPGSILLTNAFTPQHKQPLLWCIIWSVISLTLAVEPIDSTFRNHFKALYFKIK